MSAYLCSAKHIGDLAAAMHHDNPYHGTPGELAELLARENIRSVAYRYAETPTQVVGHSGYKRVKEYVNECKEQAWWASREEQRIPGLHTKIGMVSSYTYQSCEHPGWEGSKAAHVSFMFGMGWAKEVLRQEGHEFPWL